MAFDIVESLSDEDARRMAKIAFDGRAFEWAARLGEAVFERSRAPEDAYEDVWFDPAIAAQIG